MGRTVEKLELKQKIKISFRHDIRLTCYKLIRKLGNVKFIENI